MDYMTHDLMPAARGAANFTVYNPDDYWSSVVYEKGGCVLHMLRWVMGDSSFFQALREYGAEHAYGNAGGQIKCEITLLNNGMQLDFYDTGESFDPNAIPSPKSDPYRLEEGGYGLHIVRQIMDVVSYEHNIEKGNNS